MQEWDKQEGESAKAYLSFSCYLALEEKRSLTKVVEAMEKEAQKDPTKYSPKLAQLKLWSKDFSWVKRAASWDAEQLANALQQLEASRMMRRVKLQNDEWEAAQELLDRIKAINKLPLTERYVESEKKDPQGRVVQQFITIKPIRARASDAARLLDMFSKLSRLSTGLETDRVKIDMEVKAQLETFLSDLPGRVSPELLAELHAYLAERLGERPPERVLS